MHTTSSTATTGTVDSSTNNSSPSISSQPPKLAPYFAVGPEEQDIICPLCNEKVKTVLRSRKYYFTALYDCLICLSCCFPAFTILCLVRPFMPCSKQHHYCPKCEGYIGRYRRP